jgi:hypothetical protein
MMINMAMQGAKNEQMFDQGKLNQVLSPGAKQKLRGE